MDESLRSVILYFWQTRSISRKNDTQKIDTFQATCEELFLRDYKCAILDNSKGRLCSTYPPRIIVPLREKTEIEPTPGQVVVDEGIDPIYMENIIFHSRGARVKDRFPAPVILLRGKYVCRSSTLSRGAEVILKDPQSKTKQLINHIYDYYSEKDIERHSFIEKERNYDIRLMHMLGVQHICDLMVEDRKKCYGLYVCSSEKVDQYNRYENAKFLLNSIPYPGVEFFTKYREKAYDAKGLQFCWQNPENTAEITIRSCMDFPWDWSEYRDWDLIKLTQSYIYLILHYLADPSSNLGLLVHCISGWDRTPLFVSLIRILLWAEGEIHPSLSVDEIMYLNVTYDWFLFCHQFCHRFSRGEDIFHFCYEVLQYLIPEEYSLSYHRSESRRISTNSKDVAESLHATYKNGSFIDQAGLLSKYDASLRAQDNTAGNDSADYGVEVVDDEHLNKDVLFDMEGDDIQLVRGNGATPGNSSSAGHNPRPRSDQFWIGGHGHIKPEPSFLDDLLRQSSLPKDEPVPEKKSNTGALPQQSSEDDFIAHDVYRITGDSVEQNFMVSWSEAEMMAKSPEAAGSWEVISAIERRRALEQSMKNRYPSHAPPRHGSSALGFTSSSDGSVTEHFEARPYIDAALSTSVKLIYTTMKDGLVQKPILLEDYDGLQSHQLHRHLQQTQPTRPSSLPSAILRGAVKDSPLIKPANSKAANEPVDVEPGILLLNEPSSAAESHSSFEPSFDMQEVFGSGAQTAPIEMPTSEKSSGSAQQSQRPSRSESASSSLPSLSERQKRLLSLRQRFLEIYGTVIGTAPNSSGGLWDWLNLAVA